MFVAASLAMAGFIGSFTHCAAMCGPFVLAQDVPGRLELRRLGLAARLPYHAGRATTYAALGAVAGGIGAQAAALPGFRWLSTALLLIAALLFVAQLLAAPLPGFAQGFSERIGQALSHVSCPLLQRSGWMGGYLLGITLGFLPCGLLYGALTAAAAAGGVLAGALAMAAFAAGTSVCLILIALGADAVTRRWRPVTRWIAKPFQIANAVMLVLLAVNLWTRMPAQ